MRYVATGFCSLLLLVTASAQAEWLEASSDHFVIYSEQDEAQTRRFAQQLERYHGGMAFIFGKAKTRPGPSNRVTVFIVSSATKVRKVSGTQNPFVAGMYIPRAGASVALVPKVGRATHSGMSGETILYHEYAHHFMIANLTDRAYPRWFTEGFAEFFASARFREDGSVVLGAPASHRARDLAYSREVPMRTFLDFDGGYRESKLTHDSFYGQSWILFHYLLMEEERKGELTRYQQLLAEGDSALGAAEEAFGDLGQLENDMESYMRRRTLNAVVVPAKALSVGAIAVRELRPGEAAMMPTIIESQVGVSREEALALVPEARRVAALHPNDATVLAALAEAEFDAGNDAAAIAAADAALAIDPKQIRAHLQKGYALFRQVESGASPKESWKDVRIQFVKANAAENDHPIPLVQFYLTYLKQGQRPTENAIAGLEWAMQLAPFDDSLRWLVVQQMNADQRYADAARTLAPLAYSPHPGERTDEARRLLKEIEARIESAQVPSPDASKAE